MREILFKAKRINTREWVEGYLCKHPSAVQVGETSPWYIHVPPVDPDDVGGIYNVNVETVCQYTGLTDKNGVKIWEGDKLRGWWFYGREIDSYVSFRYGAFGIVWMRGKIEEFSAFTSICNVEFEVVGNIHDKEN